MRHSAIILFLIVSFSCTDEISEIQVKLSNPENYNMKFIPKEPTSDQEIKMVIADDCTYNVLSGVARDGKQIKITKQFNSMMKWPCIQKTDTILIGKLPEGSYTVNYRLIDISTQVSKSEVLSVYFLLKVSK